MSLPGADNADPQNLAVTADGRRLFVLDAGNQAVQVFDTSTRALVASYGFGNAQAGPTTMAVTADGGIAYVTGEAPQSVIAISTTSTDALLPTLPPVYGGMAVSPDGTRLYVGVADFQTPGSEVAVVDTTTGTLVGTVPIAGVTQQMVVSPDNSRLFVGLLSNEIDVVDTTTLKVGMILAPAPVAPSTSRWPCPATAPRCSASRRAAPPCA